VTRRTAALPLACAWLAAAAPAARAQPAGSATQGRVQLEVAGCPGVPAADVWQVLHVEIGDLLLDPSEREARDADRLLIRCAGNFASVEAIGAAGGPPTERILPLDDFPGDAAPRALALLGAELLAARSAAVRERILRRQAGGPAPAGPAPVAARPGPAPDQREARLGLSGVWRTFAAQDGASVWGGRLGAGVPASKRGILAGDLELAAGRREVPAVGRVTVWLLSAAATVGLRAGSRRWRASLGLGGRVGLVRESGDSADPARISSATFVRPWGGPMLSAVLSGGGGRLGFTIAGEAGWSLSSVQEVAGGATAQTVRGPWLALSLGADLRVR
jgi:hypothetical protein